MLNGGPVSWYSKRQATVALSSTEAEYVALTLAAKEATWLRLLLTELGILQPTEQYAEIKFAEESTRAAEIRVNLRDQEEERQGYPQQHYRSFNRRDRAFHLSQRRQPMAHRPRSQSSLPRSNKAQ